MSSYCGRTAAWSAHIKTVAFQGIEALDVDVQVSISSGLPSFIIVGLPDKAVGESRERVRSAISAMDLALPPKRITVKLAPADMLKEGSHFDLPIALGLLVGVEETAEYAAIGELGLDGALIPVAGAPVISNAPDMRRSMLRYAPMPKPKPNCSTGWRCRTTAAKRS